MSGTNVFDGMINQALLRIRTTDLARVVGIRGNDTALLQPLTMHKPVGGVAEMQSTISALIPRNLKCKEQTITYKIPLTDGRDTETTTFLVPASLAVGDIVVVGFCDRDISNAKRGVISEATNRHHNVNDGVILRVL